MKKPKGDVEWYAPNKKKPIAWSTTATSDLIVALAQENETITDVCNAVNYDLDAELILQQYIDLGYGNEIAREWFK